MKTVTSAPKEIQAIVGDWSNLRTVIIEDDRVLMEVARTSNNCHHCPTCRRRVNCVEQTLNGTALVWKWEYLSRGGMWLAIARQEDDDPIELLRRATSLDIRTR